MGRASTLVVATKIPPKNLTWPSRRGFTLDECFPPEHIKRICPRRASPTSACRQIDLLQFHVWEDAWAER